MRTDTGLSSYPVKVAGVIISAISLIGFVICKLVDYDPLIIRNLQLNRLFTLLFAKLRTRGKTSGTQEKMTDTLKKQEVYHSFFKVSFILS